MDGASYRAPSGPSAAASAIAGSALLRVQGRRQEGSVPACPELKQSPIGDKFLPLFLPPSFLSFFYFYSVLFDSRQEVRVESRRVSAEGFVNSHGGSECGMFESCALPASVHICTTQVSRLVVNKWRLPGPPPGDSNPLAPQLGIRIFLIQQPGDLEASDHRITPGEAPWKPFRA